MGLLITRDTFALDEVLNVVAHVPTRNLLAIAEREFFGKLTDKDFIRLAALLARKSYNEGGCPIGAVIIDNETRLIRGKGHNTLVQDNDPYNHGETSAMRDAGRIDFSTTTIFSSLNPCVVCATLIYARGFSRVVVGDATNTRGNVELLREKGVRVDILEDDEGVALYAKYRAERPDLDVEDWKGRAALRRS
jgi:cytosine/creatinine deaminase